MRLLFYWKINEILDNIPSYNPFIKDLIFHLIRRPECYGCWVSVRPGSRGSANERTLFEA
ncbi:hypothetical protein SAMN05216524_102176 [Mucilaginibacter sp. OK098]|nr:hypothetical protein SAMN05216524_102176 [Mucilaginibacter sp. OK098]